LARSSEISLDLVEFLARSSEISPDLVKILAISGEISEVFGQFSSFSHRISFIFQILTPTKSDHRSLMFQPIRIDHPLGWRRVQSLSTQSGWVRCGLSTNPIQPDPWTGLHRILHPPNNDVEGWVMANLIDHELHEWMIEVVMALFHEKEADAICKIPFSRRSVFDSITWLHNKNGKFTVKSAYRVAQQVLKVGRGAESSNGRYGKQVWSALWKLKIPNKIKVFGWRACHDILLTRLYLTKRRIISDNMCPICCRCPESTIHVLWECAATQNVWASSVKILQKGCTGQNDLLHLLEYLLDPLSLEEVEVFLIHAWLIWNRHNSVIHGGRFIDPVTFNQRAVEYLEEYKHAQQQLHVETVM